MPNVAILCIVLINPVRECGAILLSSPYSASHELRPDTSPEQLELEWLLLAVQTAVACTAQLLTQVRSEEIRGDTAIATPSQSLSQCK